MRYNFVTPERPRGELDPDQLARRRRLHQDPTPDERATIDRLKAVFRSMFDRWSRHP